MKTIPKPYDFDHFGLGRVGEHFTKFSNQNVWGKCGKIKNALDFPSSSQNAWGVSHGTVVCGGFLNKTHGRNAIQSKTHWAYCTWNRAVAIQMQKAQCVLL